MRRSNPDGKVAEPIPARSRWRIYTRKSTEEGLDQEFNSLDAQREPPEAFIQSPRREGWIASPEFYNDGGLRERPLEIFNPGPVLLLSSALRWIRRSTIYVPTLFVSIAAVNPSLTIMANALRVGDHLLERPG